MLCCVFHIINAIVLSFILTTWKQSELTSQLRLVEQNTSFHDISVEVIEKNTDFKRIIVEFQSAQTTPAVLIANKYVLALLLNWLCNTQQFQGIWFLFIIILNQKKNCRCSQLCRDCRFGSIYRRGVTFLLSKN
jgi:hypothetical protein